MMVGGRVAGVGPPSRLRGSVFLQVLLLEVVAFTTSVVLAAASGAGDGGVSAIEHAFTMALAYVSVVAVPVALTAMIALAWRVDTSEVPLWRVILASSGALVLVFFSVWLGLIVPIVASALLYLATRDNEPVTSDPAP